MLRFGNTYVDVQREAVVLVVEVVGGDEVVGGRVWRGAN